MDQAITVFVNGIAGVFAGMAMLYLTIRLISLIADRGNQKPDRAENK